MAKLRLKAVVAILAAGSVFFSSTAIAATSVGASQQVNPWGVLEALSGGAPTVAVCGGTAVSAAAQTAPGCVLPVTDAPPPPPQAAAPPPPVEAAGGYGITPLLLGLLALAAGIGFLFLVNGHHHHTVPISPS